MSKAGRRFLGSKQAQLIINYYTVKTSLQRSCNQRVCLIYRVRIYDGDDLSIHAKGAWVWYLKHLSIIKTYEINLTLGRLVSLSEGIINKFDI